MLIVAFFIFRSFVIPKTLIMKKIIYPLAVTMLALVSCKKDYTCSCTNTRIETVGSTSTSSVSSSKITVKDVKKSFITDKYECHNTVDKYSYETITGFDGGGNPIYETVNVTSTHDCSIEN